MALTFDDSGSLMYGHLLRRGCDRRVWLTAAGRGIGGRSVGGRGSGRWWRSRSPLRWRLAPRRWTGTGAGRGIYYSYSSCLLTRGKEERKRRSREIRSNYNNTIHVMYVQC